MWNHEGTILKIKSEHKEAVNCVKWAKDHDVFASVGNEKKMLVSLNHIVVGKRGKTFEIY